MVNKPNKQCVTPGMRKRIPGMRKRPDKTHKVGRPRNKGFVTYEMAVRIVREANIRSRDHYIRWVQSNGFLYLPTRPHSVYGLTGDWDTWGSFLGNNNIFDKHPKKTVFYRPYWDAVRYSQVICNREKITSYPAWRAWHKQSTDVPRDIPRWPHNVYPEFKIRNWLGKSLEDRIETATQNTPIMALHHVKGEPKNVVTLHKWPDLTELKTGGPTSLTLGEIYCAWEFEADRALAVDTALTQHGQTTGHSFIISNMHQLKWDLISVVEVKLVIL